MKILRDILSAKLNILQYVSLCIGIFVLLATIQTYINVRQLITSPETTAAGKQFIIIHKNISNALMGQPEKTVFSETDTRLIAQQPNIDSVYPIISNQFPVSAMAGGSLEFYTQLFVESVPATVLDIDTSQFSWKPGQQQVPIIISSDFLQLYNFGFAISQGLPQLSEETAQQLPFELSIRLGNDNIVHPAKIVGFTQRFESILVPSSFINWYNRQVKTSINMPSRLVLLCKDPANPELQKFLSANNLMIAGNNSSTATLRLVLQIVFICIGLLALVICYVSLLNIMYLIRLRLSEIADKLQVLSLIGYSPKQLLQVYVKQTFIQLIIISVIALMMNILLQFVVSTQITFLKHTIHTGIHPILYVLCVLLFLGLILRVRQVILRFIIQYAGIWQPSK